MIPNRDNLIPTLKEYNYVGFLHVIFPSLLYRLSPRIYVPSNEPVNSKQKREMYKVNTEPTEKHEYSSLITS